MSFSVDYSVLMDGFYFDFCGESQIFFSFRVYLNLIYHVVPPCLCSDEGNEFTCFGFRYR